MNTPTDADELLQDFELANPSLAAIVAALRQMIRGTSPSLEEGVKYGGIVYTRDDTLLGGIFMSKKHVSLEFSFGASLVDKHRMLEGKGKYRRHLKFRTIEDILTKEAQYYISRALL